MYFFFVFGRVFVGDGTNFGEIASVLLSAIGRRFRESLRSGTSVVSSIARNTSRVAFVAGKFSLRVRDSRTLVGFRHVEWLAVRHDSPLAASIRKTPFASAPVSRLNCESPVGEMRRRKAVVDQPFEISSCVLKC